MNLSSECSESESDNIWNLKTKLLELFDFAPNKVYFFPKSKEEKFSRNYNFLLKFSYKMTSNRGTKKEALLCPC